VSDGPSATTVPGSRGKVIVVVTLAGNTLGAILTYSYFRFIDPAMMDLHTVPGRAEIAFSVVAFVGLVALRPVLAADRATDAALVRRRVLLFPFAVAAITLTGWALAGILWGVVWPLLAGYFSLTRAVRQIFGITGIAGSITTAFIFFSVERHWRKVLPGFFPEGDLGAVPGVIRLSVRIRLLAIFLLIGVAPLSVLAVLSLTSAGAIMRADAATAGEIVGSLTDAILFIVAVGIVAAVGLSIFVAGSVAGPLRRVQLAMAEVGQGRLDARCPVVTNDEIGAVAEGFNQMLHGLRERDFVKETFGKYVTPEIRDEILAGRVALEGQTLEVTILFSDLRDFTPWVETTDPREVVRDLNAYFTEMEGAIREHGGLVLQYIGDEIEAVFGAPLPTPRHADMALSAALEMRHRLARWNAERETVGKPALRHGIGVHTGPVLAGNIGSAERMSYALVGDPVNLASRIQDLTKHLGADVLVSDATRRRLSGAFALEELPAMRVKGKSAEVEVYKLR
jgi:adenylate cyclase